MHENSTKFGRVVFEIWERTDVQTCSSYNSQYSTPFSEAK